METAAHVVETLLAIFGAACLLGLGSTVLFFLYLFFKWAGTIK